MTAEPVLPSFRAIPEEDLGSPAQQERRRRILDATMALASKGGFEAVQMRAVAERADVALGTLYRYFPSKIHLLVTAMTRELTRIHEQLHRSQVPGRTPAERTVAMLRRITRGLQRDPELTEAMTRAFMFADASVAAEATETSQLLERMLTFAMADDQPTERQKAIAQVIRDVWMSNLVAWVTRRASAEDVTSRLELTVDLLLGPGSDR